MEVSVQNSCIICNRWFDWHEPVITKLPEWTSFCIGCSEKYRDKNVYKWINQWWVVEYEPWTLYVYE